MPSSVSNLFAAAGLEAEGWVNWGAPVPRHTSGVYVVALTDSIDAVAGTRPRAPLSDDALRQLRSACPQLALDGTPDPSEAELRERISRYWLVDECVLYIGLAGTSLSTRVRQYYKTPLGAAKPHKGGWWLKTLAEIDDLHIHFAAAQGVKDAEEAMLRAFAAGVSNETRSCLPAGDPVMPFANLRDGDWRRRRHGITGATTAATSAPKKTNPAARPLSPALVSGAGRDSPSVASPLHPSQKVTANDIAVGQVRIPRGASKAILPAERGYLAVSLRGRVVTARWDPRFGPPERSGVIRVGKAAAHDLLRPGQVLAVAVDANGVVSLD
jgi:hypothetical protein